MGQFIDSIKALRETIYGDSDKKIEKEEEEKNVIETNDEKEINIDDLENDVATLQEKVNIKDAKNTKELANLSHKVNQIEDPTTRNKINAEVKIIEEYLNAQDMKSDLEQKIDFGDLTMDQKEEVSGLYAGLLNASSITEQETIENQILNTYASYGLEEETDLESDMSDSLREAKNDNGIE